MIQKQGQRRAPQSDDLAFEVYLRCPQLANASRVLGNLGDDILSKITLKSGVRAIPLRHLRFRLTDLVVCHHPHKFEDLPETKLDPSMWSMLKGLDGEAAGEVGWSTAAGNCCCSSRSFRMSRLPS